MDNSTNQISQSEQRTDKQKQEKKKQKLLKKNITMKLEQNFDPHQALINENYEDDRFEPEDNKNETFSEWQNVNPDLLRISYKNIKKGKK